MSDKTTDPWGKMAASFSTLKDEEGKLLNPMGAIGMRLTTLAVRRSVNFNDQYGIWKYVGEHESIRYRFELLAAKAGIALESPLGIEPERYWLHRLFAELQHQQSGHVHASADGTGAIDDVTEASANYCVILERQSLLKSAMSRESVAVQTTDHQDGGKQLLNSKRLSSTITSAVAVQRMDLFREQKGLGITEFATQAGTTDRTLRRFRKTGKVRRETLDGIAKAMGISREDILKPHSSGRDRTDTGHKPDK